MKPKRLDFRILQKKLRSDSFDLYLRAMNELFLKHEKFDFVQKLRGFFRSKRYDLALQFADSLSAQKYSDATIHFVANQFAMLVRKYPWNPAIVKTDPEKRAIDSFLKSERRCNLLNRKFYLYDNYRSPHEFALSKMRNFIKYVIGEKPPMERILDNTAFGSGASIGVHGNATNLSRKILKEGWSVSSRASSYGYWAIMRNPHLRDLLLDSRNLISCHDYSFSREKFYSSIHVIENNKISFVPKTAKTHRAIAVEPLINGLLQKGIDTTMRKHLLRVGIDLSDQSRNQRMAQLGSTTDSQETSYVTIDLSSASDNISIGLVRSLLPHDWFELLNSTRSHSYSLRGKVFPYTKFCSMGNGFCFPLETLIFTACCVSAGAGVPGQNFSVYGDDIIVEKQYAVEVLRLLRVLGFSPNVDKTFLQGPFRESCGSDWFGGLDVRPYTLDYALDSLEALFKWLNLTRRNTFSKAFFEGTEDVILSSIPHRYRFWRPFKGNPDCGIDVFGSEHMTSRTCFFERRSRVWLCRELIHQPVYDLDFRLDAYRRDSADVYSLLSGVQSVRGKVGYTLRRKTRTTTGLTVSSGATSMLLPRDKEFDVLLRANGILL